MTDRDDRPEESAGPGAEDLAGEEPVREKTGEDSPQAGIREVAAAFFILIVIIGGLAYAWFQGFEMGKSEGLEQGQDEANEIRLEAMRRLPFGVSPKWHVLLEEGQTVRLYLEGPGDERQEVEVNAGAGDRVVVSVSDPEDKPDYTLRIRED